MEPENFDKSWQKVAKRRHKQLFCLVVIPAVVAGGFMAQALPHRGAAVLEPVLVLFFVILNAWISVGFWSSVAGFILLLRRYDQFIVTRHDEQASKKLACDAHTAILIPVYNETVDRVTAGLYAVYRSLEQTGNLEKFDFFILSDSTDPDKWVEEEAAWQELCRATGGQERIFYRNRRANINRKSGNIADFCRRWGYKYRYMIVFDADSVMSGTTLIRMVAAMETHSTVGILQTSPKAIFAKTLFARLQQFANHLYSPMFSAGLHFWQLGDAQYWGHNAIIRIEPFRQHCALPVLPGRPPLGGTILSHDFVEASLMRRAGWGVWLAYDLDGSYEEGPPTLVDELKRDRRWCQGNLQHLRLLFNKGIFPAHRTLFLTGAMAYVSGLLWFLFLLVSTAEAVFEAIVPPTYFPAGRTLFPEWPVWNPGWGIIILVSTLILLFLPKILSLMIISVKQRRAKEFGGFGKLLLSMTIEIVFSTLLAPIRMIFHSKFVFSILAGRQVGWKTQQREDLSTSWLDAIHFHGFGMVLGVFWSTAVWLIAPDFFWWLTPILLALILSVPLSVWSSRTNVGHRFRQMGFLLTPVETDPPPELRAVQSYQQDYNSSTSPLSVTKDQGFVRAVTDPCVHALHLTLLRKERRYSEEIAGWRRELSEKALTLGPEMLCREEKKALLCDPAVLKSLHQAVWAITDQILARKWHLIP